MESSILSTLEKFNLEEQLHMAFTELEETQNKLRAVTDIIDNHVQLHSDWGNTHTVMALMQLQEDIKEENGGEE